MRCPGCGHGVRSSAFVCKHCGRRLARNDDKIFLYLLGAGLLIALAILMI